MIKSIFSYSLVFFSLFFIAFHLHENYIENLEVILPFSLRKVYLFHLGFSMLICVNFKAFSTVDKIFEQLGFVYLFILFLKIIVFIAIFYKVLFAEENLTQIARISLFIPMFIYLLTEVIFVSRILNKKE
ncbi:DUF6168 family protein [Polaribacter ponticola]|uniref:DUF6168 family protein n=1 Tax=Polaribacter ponticola TaxID=2978475 RepID=A0ABT5SCB7_9FLAO|nr:DUF6168 family protein [Polaribacter sp. MSW5]MDD7915454.1 DUF6168 family protein [Polaribacter sp. MSW5]